MVYRGMTVDIKTKIGEKITFQAFTSTTNRCEIAREFALQEVKDGNGKVINPDRTLLKMKVK